MKKVGVRIRCGHEFVEDGNAVLSHIQSYVRALIAKYKGSERADVRLARLCWFM